MIQGLAQSGNDTRGIFFWSVVMMALVVGGFLLVSWVRRQLKEPDQGTSGGFTLADLREMRKKGQISEEEFEKAKTQMNAAIKAAAERKKQMQADDDRLTQA